jgi:hypothetical protein
MTIHKLTVVCVVFAATVSRADDHDKKPGINISVHDGKVDIDGIGAYVDHQIDAALAAVDRAGAPPEIREKLRARLNGLRGKLARRLSHLDADDMDQLGEEMGRIGEEIGREMDNFGRDMDAWGKDYSKKFSHDFTKRWQHAGHHAHVDVDRDNDDDLGGVSDDDDDHDMDDTVRSLGDLSLGRGQRDQIRRLRADSDRQVAAAKDALAQAERVLHDQLDNPAASDADISRAIDAVTQQEAAIRKARILAWHAARRVLDDSQRRRLETAVHAK